MNIQDKSIETVADEVSRLLNLFDPDTTYPQGSPKSAVDSTTSSALQELLNIRGQIVDRIKSVTSLIDTIEAKVKEKQLPAGTYGLVYPLVVTSVAKTTIFDNLVIAEINKLGLTATDYMVLDHKNKTVKKVIEDNPSCSLKEAGAGANRHSFK